MVVGEVAHGYLLKKEESLPRIRGGKRLDYL
jgi:hypothetical protein